MASQQPARPFFRLGSINPVQTTPQRAPPPTPAPQVSIVRPAVPRFRTPVAETTPQQETAQALPRQIGPPAAPAPPPTTVTRDIVAQPQASLTNSASNSSPARLPTATTSTPSSLLPSVVAPAPVTNPTPLLRPPPTQPNLATSKPVSPQPRFMASTIPSSPTTKTETVMRSSPQQTAAAAAPPAVPSPRFPTDKSPIPTSTARSPAALQPQIITSVTSASPTRESTALQNSLIKKPYPEPSTTPTITSPVRKLSAPSRSPESKTVLGSRSPPPSEPLPTTVPGSIVPSRGHTPASSPRNGTMLYKTPPQSPIIRPLTHPPSPLTLQPAQIKTEINHQPNTVTKHQTTVMTQERNGKPKVIPRVSDTYEANKYVGQDGGGKDAIKKNAEAEESGMRVIRLAGQNHGAIMELSPSLTKGNRNGWTNGRKTGTEYGKVNEEESSNIKNNKSMAIQAPPLTAFMNSNVQGMNNSIVYNSSFNHNDPGVHFSFSKNQMEDMSRTT